MGKGIVARTVADVETEMRIADTPLLAVKSRFTTAYTIHTATLDTMIVPKRFVDQLLQEQKIVSGGNLVIDERTREVDRQVTVYYWKRS